MHNAAGKDKNFFFQMFSDDALLLLAFNAKTVKKVSGREDPAPSWWCGCVTKKCGQLPLTAGRGREWL